MVGHHDILVARLHRSVSFPKTRSIIQAPTYFTPLALGSLHKPDYKPTILAIDSYAPKRTWYRRGSVYINDDTMMLSKEENHLARQPSSYEINPSERDKCRFGLIQDNSGFEARFYSRCRTWWI